MHLSVEMIGQSAVVVKSTQVSTADVADLEFLMA